MRERRFPSEQESRIDWWRQVISRQQSTGVPLTQFCRQMGISYRKFSYWRQRLCELDAASSKSHTTTIGSPKPSNASVRDTAAAFVPVSIIDRSSTTTTAVEIELANGCSVRFTGTIDPGLLRAAIMAAGELGNFSRGDH
jgi:hypothetical protein